MNTNKQLLSCILAAAGLVAFPALAERTDTKILQFDTMAGVTAPYTGPLNPIRNVPGGGLPWSIERAKGELRADGRLEIEVQGLVLAADPAVPPDRQLTNPVASFRATVSCLSIDGLGQPTTVNVGTDAFPATPGGDAKIEATVQLPTPCLAPVIFVTNPNGAWFAVTGQ